VEQSPGGFAAVVLVDTLDDHVLTVFDPEQDKPKCKLPGGTGERVDWERAQRIIISETGNNLGRVAAEMCARRETLEESGVDLDFFHPKPLPFLIKVLRGDGVSQHYFWVFRVSLPFRSTEIALPKQGESGEIPAFVHAGSALTMDFLPGQMALIRGELNDIVWRKVIRPPHEEYLPQRLVGVSGAFFFFFISIFSI